MSILDFFLSLLVPHECIACRVEGGFLCTSCTRLLQKPKQVCYKCLAPTVSGITCPKCLPISPLIQTNAAAVYSGLAKDIVWGLKSAGMQSAVVPMAGLMHTYVPSGVLLLPVPTATSRVRQRGYDQSILLAKELGHQTKTPVLAALARTGQSHQVGANREQRLKQLDNAFYVRRPKTVVGKHILLIDDVMTTGATLEAAAKTLREAGAARVDALTFARA